MLADIPRRVWFHWWQGRREMPPVVGECLKSWTSMNPDWDLVFLDAHSVWEHLDRTAIPTDALLRTSPQVYANAIRLQVLARHGGVWADATTWCRRPLSAWLTDMPGEFFAFASPGPDRMMANWFMASLNSGYLAATLAKEYVGLFERLGPLTALPASTTAEILASTETTDVFLDDQLLVTRGYAYFLFHYLFASLYRRDSRFRDAWDATAKVTAHACHAAQFMDLLAPADDAARQVLRAADPPMHKLTWRMGQIPPGSLLHDIVTGVV
ncbi:MAG TPA: capsular polysaccharide synthesis protein [Vicinamibacterales bacterium]|nr:capsular polysaccharide synthesis protein [Vicinamibacterales bacterium]